MREAGRILSVAVIIAVAVNTDRRRAVRGLDVGRSEAEVVWTKVLRARTPRGLRGVTLVISDAPEGLKAAAATVLSATWQRCRSPFTAMRWRTSAPPSAPWWRPPSAPLLLKRPRRPPIGHGARLPIPGASARPRCATLMDEAEHDVLADLDFPRHPWAKMSSTTPLERVNGEIRRRTDVLAICPKDAAIIRLTGAIRLEQNDQWAAGRRDMSLETIAPVGHTDAVRLPAGPT